MIGYVNGQLNPIPACPSLYNVYSGPFASSRAQHLTQLKLPARIHLTSQETPSEVERHVMIVICDLPSRRVRSTVNHQARQE